jgi:transposase InsO family protein
MREMSVAEQRYLAVLAVIADGMTVKDAAAKQGVSRQTMHAWLAKYEAGGLEALSDGSHRPRSCPHQMPAESEALVAELRRAHVGWGPRRLSYELARRGGVDPVPSESAVYRCLVRLGLIEPDTRRRRRRDWKRWERGTPMELWQMDTVGGIALADGSHAKALTGIDDHSRFCVSAALMAPERTRPVCDGLAAAMRAYGVPTQILTDNAKVFTGRFNSPPVEVLFDRVCRENGIEHLLTAPRTPTTTGKVERFHKTMREEFLTDRIFTSLRAAQAELDAWVWHYNHDRPHQMIGMQPPAQRFYRRDPDTADPGVDDSALAPDRGGDDWIARRVASNGIIAVSWQQISVGKHRAGAQVDVHVTDQLLQIWHGPELLKTVRRDSRGEVRKKRASVHKTTL